MCRFHGGTKRTLLTDREFLEAEVGKAERKLARLRSTRVRLAVVERCRLRPPADAVELALIRAAREGV